MSMCKKNNNNNNAMNERGFYRTKNILFTFRCRAFGDSNVNLYINFYYFVFVKVAGWLTGWA